MHNARKKLLHWNIQWIVRHIKGFVVFPAIKTWLPCPHVDNLAKEVGVDRSKYCGGNEVQCLRMWENSSVLYWWWDRARWIHNRNQSPMRACSNQLARLFPMLKCDNLWKPLGELKYILEGIIIMLCQHGILVAVLEINIQNTCKDCNQYPKIYPLRWLYPQAICQDNASLSTIHHTYIYNTCWRPSSFVQQQVRQQHHEFRIARYVPVKYSDVPLDITHIFLSMVKCLQQHVSVGIGCWCLV